MPATPRTLDATALHALLAHRFPFLLVDRIDVLEPGRRVVGTKRLTAGEWASGGPALGRMGTPAVPSLLVVEALAQTSAALLVDVLEDAPGGAIGYFAALERVRLRAPAAPGDTLRLAVELRAFRRGIARLRGLATVEGRRVVSADFTTVVRAR